MIQKRKGKNHDEHDSREKYVISNVSLLGNVEINRSMKNTKSSQLEDIDLEMNAAYGTTAGQQLEDIYTEMNSVNKVDANVDILYDSVEDNKVRKKKLGVCLLLRAEYSHNTELAIVGNVKLLNRAISL